MKKENKGISLIVLIITIIIMIVLAGTIILTLTNNDIIGNSRIAMFKNNAANYKSDLNMTISDKMLSDSTFNKYLVNAYTLSDIKEYIPSMKAGDEEKFAIQAGDLVYIGGDSDEIIQMREIGIDDGFIEGVTYSKVYLNPNISMDPNDLEGVPEQILGEGAVPNVIITMGYENMYLLVKKDSTGEVEQPMAMIMITENGLPFAIYNFNEISFEEEGETLTIPKGWLSISPEDEVAIMTEEEIKEIELNLNEVTGSSIFGNEFLHYYFSTVPY